MSTQSQTLVVPVKDVFKGALLISGTMIGGGMLVLPVLTAQVGFFPSLLVYFLSWIVMAFTGIFIFEVSLACGSKSNLITMASATLGKTGKALCWVLYLFLFYSLMTAYTAGAGSFLGEAFGPFFSGPMGLTTAALLFLPILLRGVKLASSVNFFLVVGLILSFLVFVYLGVGSVSVSNLEPTNWPYFFAALPIAFTSFSFQGTVPTVANFLDNDPKSVKRAIWIGTAIPLLMYIVWLVLILGIVPLTGPFGLEGAQSAVTPLKHWVNHPALDWAGQSFAFFALFTSVIGVALGLLDFLSDGLKLAKKGVTLWFLAALVVIPPLLINLMYEGLFIKALGYAGGIGCALLLGMMPTLMVWQVRKSGNFPLTKGGTPLLFFLILFFCIEVLLTVANLV